MNDKIEQLSKFVKNSKNTVFFGGAGVSTESGVPTLEAKTVFLR